MSRPPRILFVCTANQCRSPLAEVIARHEAERRQAQVSICSAGFLAAGVPAAENSRRVAQERGLSLEDHRSTQLDRQLVDDCDVILTMEASHVLDISGISADASARAATLKEMASTVDRGTSGDDCAAQRSIEQWTALATDRHLSALMSADNDVADPIGRSVRAFRRTANELESLIVSVYDAWFGPPLPSRRD